MLIIEQSTLQIWWHNHCWGFRLLVNACSWTRIKNPHVGVNWPRRVSQELQELHPGGRRSHSAGLDLSPPSHFKKIPEQQNVLKLFGREQANMANMAEVPLKWCDAVILPSYLEVVGVSHGNQTPTEAAISEFPVDYINCVSAWMKESEIR